MVKGKRDTLRAKALRSGNGYICRQLKPGDIIVVQSDKLTVKPGSQVRVSIYSNTNYVYVETPGDRRRFKYKLSRFVDSDDLIHVIRPLPHSNVPCIFET